MYSSDLFYLCFTPNYAKVGGNPLDYRYSCSGEEEVVPLAAMCNGSVECTNGEDETHAFCPRKRRAKRATGDCNPECLNDGVCHHDGSCLCPDAFTGDQCQYGKTCSSAVQLSACMHFAWK